MTSVNLHELANTPGAGRAFRVLDENGRTQPDPQAPEWSVWLSGSIPVSYQTCVRADSIAEAIKLARRAAEQVDLSDLIDGGADWDGRPSVWPIGGDHQ